MGVISVRKEDDRSMKRASIRGKQTGMAVQMAVIRLPLIKNAIESESKRDQVELHDNSNTAGFVPVERTIEDWTNRNDPVWHHEQTTAYECGKQSSTLATAVIGRITLTSIPRSSPAFSLPLH